MIQQKIIIAIMGICLPMVVNAACSLRYSCGDGTGTAPSQSTVSSGKVFTPAANTCTRDGYVFSHYLVVPRNYSYVAIDGVAQPGTEYTIPFKSNYTCSNSAVLMITAQWVEQNPSKTTSKRYTDAQLATRQPAFASDANGANKLMLFSGTTDGEIGSRDIVTTLGTPNATTGDYADTTSTTVPTNGAIKDGVDRKQDTITGTANWVSTYTATAGTVGSKPIYSDDTPYGVAVIEAGTLNAAIADAVNSELTPIDTDPNGRLWQINDVSDLVTLTERVFLDPAIPAIPGRSSCYRLLNGDVDDNGTCSADTLSYLGADGNKSGKWGTVFPYGDISGISVCSTQVAPTMGSIATDAKAATLDAEYSAQAGVGESALATNQTRCWCKMENPAASPWVYGSVSYINYSYCAKNCASHCSSSAASAITLRRGLFGI